MMSRRSCRPAIEEASVFYPSEEEFKDTINYIASIHQKAEQYGICRIVPPPSWKPPCPLKEESFWRHSKFATRVQQVDKLQNREPMKKKCRNRCQRKRKRRKLRFGMTRRRPASNTSDVNDCAASDTTEEKFGFQSGSDFTLESFNKYADDFKEQYFGIKDAIENNVENGNRWRPLVEEIEGEYWQIVEKPTEEIEVLYGADLETGVFGSGFPKAPVSPAVSEADPYELSGWNLNIFPRLPGSVLSFESGDISGVLVPWLYIGMYLSSFCWHVEDHHLYSLNYMHFGEPKIWYGTPGNDAVKLEDAMKKHLNYLKSNLVYCMNCVIEVRKRMFLDKVWCNVVNTVLKISLGGAWCLPDVTQLSPSVLKSEGVPVYRVIQNSGEFVLTFPRAFAERKEYLLGQLRQELRWNRIEEEHAFAILHKQERWTLILIQLKRVCFSCFYDLHLSAASCECSPNRFSCLMHADSLCPCESTKIFFLHRYSTDELNTLVEALEGSQSAVQSWGSDNLGLVLPSYVALFKCTSGLKQSLLSNSEDCMNKLLDNIITDSVADRQENGNQACEAFSLESKNNKSSAHYQAAEGILDNIGNKRLSSVTDDSWWPRLNTEQSSIESKATVLDCHGDIEMEDFAVKEEQGCCSHMIHQETSSPFMAAGVDGCGINRTLMEYDSLRMTNARYRSSPESRSSVFPNQFSDIGTPNGFPNQN